MRGQSSSSLLIAAAERHKGVTFLVVTLAILLIVITGVGVRRLMNRSTRDSAATPHSLDVRALTESGKVIGAAASPDGRYVAYANRNAGNFELRLLQVATERDVQVLSESPFQILSLHFSPDGNFIYFLRQLKPGDFDTLGVFRIAALGGPATPIATDATMNNVTVSPDGKQIAYIAQAQSESQIVAIDPDGANRHVLAKRPLGLGFMFVEWSPMPNTLAAVATVVKEEIGLVSVELPCWIDSRVECLRLGGGRPACMEPRWLYDLHSRCAPVWIDLPDLGFRCGHGSPPTPNVGCNKLQSVLSFRDRHG